MSKVTKEVLDVFQALIDVVKDPRKFDLAQRTALLQRTDRLLLEHDGMPPEVSVEGERTEMHTAAVMLVLDQADGPEPKRFYYGYPGGAQEIGTWSEDHEHAHFFKDTSTVYAVFEDITHDPSEMRRVSDALGVTPETPRRTGILRILITGAKIALEHPLELSCPTTPSPTKVDPSDVRLAVRLDDVYGEELDDRYYRIPENDQDAVQWTPHWGDAWVFSTLGDVGPLFEELVNYRQLLKAGQLQPPAEVIDALMLGPNCIEREGTLLILDRDNRVLHRAPFSGSFKPESFHDSGQA